MRCDRVRKFVLAAERPEPPPEEVRPHLHDCPECRAWLLHLGNVERQLTALSVPPSDGKQRLLRRLRETSPERTPMPGLSSNMPARLRERALKKLSLAFALAATVAAFAVGLWLWSQARPLPQAPAQPDLMASWKAQRDTRLAQARTPKEKVGVLADLSDSLKREASGLARGSDTDQLKALAEFYEELVGEELVAMARNVPAKERKDLLDPVRRRLISIDSEMERLAVDVPSAAESLRQIASAAREGDRKLRELIESA